MLYRNASIINYKQYIDVDKEETNMKMSYGK